MGYDAFRPALAYGYRWVLAPLLLVLVVPDREHFFALR